MNGYDRFTPADLEALDVLLDKAATVIAMADVHDGFGYDASIGLRHDCDNVIAPAVRLAEWEAERGYRSTYYVLHTAPYWDTVAMWEALEVIAQCGHEIGIHNDALTVALQTGQDPADVLFEAIEELRGYGHTIRSTVAHGNALCHHAQYVNDEMFLGCQRPIYGDPDREIRFNGCTVKLRPTPLGTFGLDFDANWLPRGDYLSDSGGAWSQPLEQVAAAFPNRGQLHILQHPDWWGAALEPNRVAA